jgi:hypothetical protein
VTKSTTPKIEATPGMARIACPNELASRSSGTLVSSVNFIAFGFGVGDGEAEAIRRSFIVRAT